MPKGKPKPGRSAGAEQKVDIRSLPKRADASFVSAYSNYAYAGASPWDIKIVFGELELADEKDLHIQNKCAVTMSVKHAKEVVALLHEKIMDWEAKFSKAPKTIDATPPVNGK